MDLMWGVKGKGESKTTKFRPQVTGIMALPSPEMGKRLSMRWVWWWSWGAVGEQSEVGDIY